jgi:hypothetical protein
LLSGAVGEGVANPVCAGGGGLAFVGGHTIARWKHPTADALHAAPVSRGGTKRGVGREATPTCVLSVGATVSNCSSRGRSGRVYEAGRAIPY